MIDVCSRWVALDERYQGGVPETEEVRVVTGRGAPLVFSAPHSVRHLRRGVEKKADIRTGGLAELLAELVGGTAITSLGKLAADPNWDSDPTPFRGRLLALLRPNVLVLDIHGMDAAHDPDVILGLGPSPDATSLEAVGRLEAALAERGLASSRGRPFPATHPGTITAAVQAAGGRALQLEVSARRRRPLRDAAAAEPLVSAIVAWALGMGAAEGTYAAGG